MFGAAERKGVRGLGSCREKNRPPGAPPLLRLPGNSKALPAAVPRGLIANHYCTLLTTSRPTTRAARFQAVQEPQPQPGADGGTNTQAQASAHLHPVSAVLLYLLAAAVQRVHDQGGGHLLLVEKVLHNSLMVKEEANIRAQARHRMAGSGPAGTPPPPSAFSLVCAGQPSCRPCLP